MSNGTSMRKNWIIIGLTFIIAINVAGSLYWLDQNIVLVGRDASGHLERTIKAANTFSEPFPRSLFQLFTLHDYRPPLLYMAAQPFYALFGYSFDIAQLVNVTLLPIILLLTYHLAQKITTAYTALFATLMLGLFPMMAALSRLFYMEHLLTTMLLINLIALLNSDGFQHRRWTLVWGISLGAAMLVKWTAPIYLVLPVLYTLWKANIRQHIAIPKVYWTRLLIALVAGAGISLLWYLPNRAEAIDFALGDWQILCWSILVTAAIYTLWRQPNRANNFTSALVLALVLASLWYVPKIDFLFRLTDVAFGTDRGNQSSLNLLQHENYTRYFTIFVQQHLGILATILILPLPLVVWMGKLSKLRGGPAGPRHPFILLWLVLLSTYLLLMLLAQSNARNLVPLLPIIAVLLADTLRHYSTKIQIAIGAIWLVVLAFQWSIYTFDEMADVYHIAPQLWVSGDYHEWPATGSTDPGYWVQPDILAQIDEPDAEKPVGLGMLIDSQELHRGSFRYLIAANQHNIELTNLTEPENKGWSELIANEWLLVKDGDNSGVRDPGTTLLQRINDGDPIFHQLYQPRHDYTLPNGEAVTLYLRAKGPRHPQDFPVLLIQTSTIADHINMWWSDHATLYFPNEDVATWVGIHELIPNQERGSVLINQDENQTIDAVLNDVTGTILAATRYDTPPNTSIFVWL